MPFFKGALTLFTGLFTRSNSAQPQAGANTHINPPATYQQRQYIASQISKEEPRAKCERWLDGVTKNNKRKASEIHESSKKRLKRSSHFVSIDTIERDGAETASRIGQRLSAKGSRDRTLMPPPATPASRKMPPQIPNHSRRMSESSSETFSEARSNVTRYTEADDEYDMEAARRHAAATQLPENSGIWEQAEKALFFHLAYRGFEPLLPSTWMVDFRTLPLSLFATDPSQVPLIQNHKHNEFRAIKALSDLVETGKLVRDRGLSPNRKLRREPLIEKAANKYIKWGLDDIGISQKNIIPVHAVVAMKRGQSTLETIRELTIKMHKLSARHRETSGVFASVERQNTCAFQGSNETQLLLDPLASEQNLPVIYGLMVCSSLLAVFTLSSHAPTPRFITRLQAETQPQPQFRKSALRSPNNTSSPAQTRNAINNENNPTIVTNNTTNANPDEADKADEDGDENEDSGLRFIHSFDFSDSASDVWNAFVIAIVAMEIRKSLAEIYDVPLNNDEDDLQEGQSFREESDVDEDDPDL